MQIIFIDIKIRQNPSNMHQYAVQNLAYEIGLI